MKIKLTIAAILYFALNTSAQIYTPSGTIQGTSGNNNVGIGTNSPTAKLHVLGTIKSFGTTPLETLINSFTLIDEVGNNAGGNSFYKRLWLYRDGESNAGWSTARLHDGISIDGTFQTPQNNTKTWWERDPYDNIQSWGNASDTYLTINKGNMGLGTTNPTAKLHVSGGIIKNYESTALGSPTSSNLLLNEIGARAGIDGNSFYKRLWLYRDSESNFGWSTVRLHDGISIDGSYETPQTNTRSWWERDPYDNIQSWGDGANTYLTINKGNVGIGIISPTNKLDVNGTIHSKEVKVDMNGWPDFVFKKEYSLPTLQEVEKHITEKGHLENIPSEEEVLKNGINLGEMNSKLLQKIEELTLYIIEIKKENIEIKERLSKLENK